MQLTFWEGLECIALLEDECLERCAVAHACRVAMSQIVFWHAARCPWASGLSGTRKRMQTRTFREGLELFAATEVERLERSAVADGCKTVARSDIPKRSGIRPIDGPMPLCKITFWDGLQLPAAREIECLESRAVADGCQAVIDLV